MAELGTLQEAAPSIGRAVVVQMWLSVQSGPGTFASYRTVFSMLASWIGIFAVSFVAEIITTCYYRALSYEGPGRRGRAMFWSGACRVIGLVLLKHVVSTHGSAGFIAASAFVAGDVVGTWVALWIEDRRAVPVVEVAPALTAAEIGAMIDARVASALAEVREEAPDRRVAVAASWRAPAYSGRRAPAPFRQLHLSE